MHGQNHGREFKPLKDNPLKQETKIGKKKKRIVPRDRRYLFLGLGRPKQTEVELVGYAVYRVNCNMFWVCMLVCLFFMFCYSPGWVRGHRNNYMCYQGPVGTICNTLWKQISSINALSCHLVRAGFTYRRIRPLLEKWLLGGNLLINLAVCFPVEMMSNNINEALTIQEELEEDTNEGQGEDCRGNWVLWEVHHNVFSL